MTTRMLPVPVAPMDGFVGFSELLWRTTIFSPPPPLLLLVDSYVADHVLRLMSKLIVLVISEPPAASYYYPLRDFCWSSISFSTNLVTVK